jgi:hypothetical protein
MLNSNTTELVIPIHQTLKEVLPFFGTPRDGSDSGVAAVFTGYLLAKDRIGGTASRGL